MTDTFATPKADALIEVLRDARNQRASTTSARRVIKACKTLGIDGAELMVVLQWLDYADMNGEPYSKRIKPIWKNA